MLAQLQAVAGYPITPVVRVPSADPVIITQVQDVDLLFPDGFNHLYLAFFTMIERRLEVSLRMS